MQSKVAGHSVCGAKWKPVTATPSKAPNDNASRVAPVLRQLLLAAELLRAPSTTENVSQSANCTVALKVPSNTESTSKARITVVVGCSERSASQYCTWGYTSNNPTKKTQVAAP